MSTVRPIYTAPAALTVTLANLASSTTGVGRQSTLIANDGANAYATIHLKGLITVAGSSTAGRNVSIYLIKGDGTRRTDDAGAADAGITRVTARLIKTIPHNVTTETPYHFDVTIHDVGREWGVIVVHDTGVALKNVAGEQFIYWVGERTEVV